MRKSGEQSIRKENSGVSTKALDLSRVFLGSDEVHTGHVHPIIGTPKDVPVPSSVIFMGVDVEGISVRNYLPRS